MKNKMNEVLLAVVAGFVVGLLFAFLKLPIPAPPVLSGVLGIMGVYLGGEAFVYVNKYAVAILSNIHK